MFATADSKQSKCVAAAAEDISMGPSLRDGNGNRNDETRREKRPRLK